MYLIKLLMKHTVSILPWLPSFSVYCCTLRCLLDYWLLFWFKATLIFSFTPPSSPFGNGTLFFPVVLSLLFNFSPSELFHFKHVDPPRPPFPPPPSYVIVPHSLLTPQVKGPTQISQCRAVSVHSPQTLLTCDGLLRKSLCVCKIEISASANSWFSNVISTFEEQDTRKPPKLTSSPSPALPRPLLS